MPGVGVAPIGGTVPVGGTVPMGGHDESRPYDQGAAEGVRLGGERGGKTGSVPNGIARPAV